MKQYHIAPGSVLTGKLGLPPSKSHSIRALYFSAMAKGQSTLKKMLVSTDICAMAQALRFFGARITQENQTYFVEGVDRQLNTPEQVIDAANSGQVLRFITALAGLARGYTILTGDASIRQRRSVAPLLTALRALGADAFSTRGDGYAPLVVRGPLHAGTCSIKECRDSQPLSALLMCAPFLAGDTEILVEGASERPWIDFTLSWLSRIGARFQNDNYRRYRISGGHRLQSFTYSVPGDFSSAAFPLVAAAITGSTITLQSADLTDVQGDKKILDLLQQMGAKVQSCLHTQTVTLQADTLRGIEVNVDDVIDAVPILAVAGCFAQGRMRLYNAKNARYKESDRLSCIAAELKKMGAKIIEKEEELVVEPACLTGTTLCSHGDHRIAMALSVAALGAKGCTQVFDVDCVAKSYPDFAKQLAQAGAFIREEGV